MSHFVYGLNCPRKGDKKPAKGLNPRCTIYASIETGRFPQPIAGKGECRILPIVVPDTPLLKPYALNPL